MSTQTQNRFNVSLIEKYPIFTPSPEALARIEAKERTMEISKEFFQTIYDILIEDQSKHGLRVHKGYPLYWLAGFASRSNKNKGLELMLEAFAEDVFTHGNRAFQGSAAQSLKEDFGIDNETLVTLKDFLTEKSKISFLPLPLIREFFHNRKQYPPIKEPFRGVTEDSQLESIVIQIERKLRDDLRASFKSPPSNEIQLQDMVYALLRQVDKDTNRERKGARLANKEFTIDFSLFGDKVGVEVKLVDRKEKVGSTIDEINADIPGYIGMFKRIIFVVYDVYNAILDDKRFIADLKKDRTGINVLVL
jgi:hypothetical protein